MSSSPITAQGNTVVDPLPRASKLDFSSNVTRFFESRKMKMSKNPRPQPARTIKATTEGTAAFEKASQKLDSSTGGGPFYDDAWDIRSTHFGLRTFTSAEQHYQQGSRGPPDGAATCESICSLTSLTPSSTKPIMFDSTTASNPEAIITTVSVSSASASASSTFAPSSPKKSTHQSDTKPVVMPEHDQADGIVTPIPSNNSNWFPPPPPTPLHLALLADKPICGHLGRYHEHRRSFEIDDDTLETKRDSDAITPPSLTLPSPSQESGFLYGGERTSVTSSLLNLPLPLPSTDFSTNDVASPPAIPPRDPKTSVTSSADPLVTDLDWQQPAFETTPHANQEEEPAKTKNQQPQQKSGFDGRSVVPWERVGPLTSAIDFSGSLPQWVPPQHSEAVALHHRTPQCIGHRASKSQSGREDLMDEDRNLCPFSSRSQSQHRRRRHNSRDIGEEFTDTIETSTNCSSGHRGAVRTNSDNSDMAKKCTLFATDDAWTDAVARDDNDSADRFARVGCDVRLHPATRSSAHHQRPSGANQSVANADMMTQSLIDWSGCDNAFPVSSSLHQQSQQQRICRHMKAVHLNDSGLVLSHQDTTSLPVYHGRQVFVSSSSNTSPDDALPCGGYFFQGQVSCPPHLGGKVNADEVVWGDGRVFQYQTAPAHAHPGQTYMLWSQHQLANSQRRRRHQNHHHSTQPIIVPAGGGTAFPVDKRSTSTKVAPLHNGRPQVLVTGRNRGKRATDLAALVSMPVEEQPWYHGHLPRTEAELLLRSAPPGSFLVRISETSKGAFSLSIRRDRDFLHMKISYDPKAEAFILGEYSQPYPTVPIMVHHYTRNLLPVRGTKPVLLKYPLCRAINSFSLHAP